VLPEQEGAEAELAPVAATEDEIDAALAAEQDPAGEPQAP